MTADNEGQETCHPEHSEGSRFESGQDSSGLKPLKMTELAGASVGHQKDKQSNQVAIIGMSCLYPGAPDLSSFWSNIVNGHDAIREASAEEWGTPADPSKLPYCKKGGFITEFAEFDPMQCGVMPNSVQGADPDQFLALKVALETLKDAGYAGKDFNREKAEVILGRISAPGAGSFNFIQQNGVTEQVVALIGSLFPHLSAEELVAVSAEIERKMPQSNADSIVSVMPNVLAGRIANRLDFRGRNLVLDAACASSLIAVQIAVEDLLSGKADLVLTGGLHVNSSLFFFKLFSGLGALSHKEMIRPFDAQSDGTILGEGVGMVLLKRLEDAVADSDRIYAVIRGVGSSSDGHGTSMLAPSVAGEVLALERAYEMAGISPRTIGLLEAHGTGTPEGDLVELKAIEKVFAGENEKADPWLALGSVKSMIGHTQAAAGVAGLIKASLALYHQTLPPTLNVSEPNPKIDWLKSPCYLLSEARPWIHPYYQGLGDHPRRAGVSAFGFGGVNAHVVLEEHIDLTAPPAADLVHKWDTEICLFKGDSSSSVIAQVDELLGFLDSSKDVLLEDVAYSTAVTFIDPTNAKQAYCLAVVASSISDLQKKLKSAIAHIAEKSSVSIDGAASGIYYSNDAANKKGKLAFLLPGLGASYPNMLRDLCLHFSEVREVFDFADYLAVTIAENEFPSDVIFPKQLVKGRKQKVSSATLATMDSAVITLLLAEWAIFHLLHNLGIEPDAVMGCSTGEFAAMPMSGTLDILAAAGLFYRHSTAVARSFPEDKVKDLRSLMVVARSEKVIAILNSLSKTMYITADMSPTQVIVTGHLDAATEAIAAFRAQGIHFHKMPSAIPYHTPLVDETTSLEPEGFQDLPMTAPIMDAWACSIAAKLPNDEESLRKMSTTLFRHPIQFRKTVELMYEDGVRIFVEVGPRDNLTPHVKEILAGKPHVATASNISTRSAISQISHLLASLAISGVNIKADYLFARRSPRKIDFAANASAEYAAAAASRQVKLDLKYPVIPTNLPVAITDLLLSQGEFVEYDKLDGEQPAADGMDEVMESYLNSVSAFQNNLMKVQETVLAEFFQQSQQFTADEIALEQLASEQTILEDIAGERIVQEESFERPFLRHANISRQADSITIQRALTLNEDRYLLDHAIGGVVSSENNDKVFLLPLMVALEMMAEAAQELALDKTLVQIKQVRANKRIRVDSNGSSLTVTARLKSAAAGASVFEAEIKNTGEEDGKECLMSCQLIFDNERAEAKQAKIALVNGGRAKLSGSKLYAPAAMFHGPTMQSVIELNAVSERKISGLVKVRPAYDWFASDPSFEYTSSFLIDPLLIDNASQLVYFHLLENEKNTSALLPFLIESIDFYEQPSFAWQDVQVKAELATISERNTEARIEIANAEGQLLMSIEGIHSKRIQLPQAWSNFIADPKQNYLGCPMPEITSRLPGDINWQCMRVSDDDMPADLGTLEWCADYVLSESERLEVTSASKVEKRKREWLAGRIAAKDAVRQLLKDECGITVCPADIEILQDENGRPLPYGSWVESAGFVPQLSITHGDGIAYALSCRPSQEFIAGIDTEPARDRGAAFEEMAFTEGELKILALMTKADREAGNTAFWCAKEAIAKAIGMGFAGKPQEFEVVDANWQSGILQVVVHESDVFAHNNRLLVHCLIEDERVTAFTACQKL